jgi:hypothetical protein
MDPLFCQQESLHATIHMDGFKKKRARHSISKMQEFVVCLLLLDQEEQ